MASPCRKVVLVTPSAFAFLSHSVLLKEAYSAPQRSMPMTCVRGLRYATAMASAPLPQPTSRHFPPAGSFTRAAVPSMICADMRRLPL